MSNPVFISEPELRDRIRPLLALLPYLVEFSTTSSELLNDAIPYNEFKFSALTVIV
jgi:hypothetical protein